VGCLSSCPWELLLMAFFTQSSAGMGFILTNLIFEYS
jgi:hypothetical protein